MKDADLLLKIINGDNAALRQVYKDNLPKVKALAGKMGKSELDAQDVFQDGIIDMLKNFEKGKFKEESSIGTYLYAICRNKFLQMDKKKKVPTIGLEDYHVDVENKVMDSKLIEEENILVQYLGQIEEDCKKILTLFYFYKKPWKEIAQLQNYTEAFVRVKSNRCKNALRKKMMDNPIIKERYNYEHK